MNRSDNQPSPNAWQWNPPKHREPANTSFRKSKNVQSATECTGLMQHVPDNEGAASSLSDLYAIHELKPQGNVGKDNPRNDPSEIHFHRQ